MENCVSCCIIRPARNTWNHLLTGWMLLPRKQHKTLCLEGMKKVFKWLLAVVVILAAVTVVVLYNPNLIREPLERRISEASGYHVSLAGDLEISIGRSATLSVTDVYVAAPQWAAHNELITIDQLFLSLEIPSLFGETIVVDSLKISGLQANLETNSDDENNWQPAKQQALGENTTSKEVIFLDVRLDDFMFRHMDQTGENQQVFYIETLNQQHRSDDMLDVAFNGSFNDRPVDFDGVIGPFKNLLVDQDVFYDGQGNFGNLEIRSKGLLDDLARPRRPQFELRIQGQNIDEITAMLGVDDLGSGNFSFSAKGGEVENHYEARLDGKIGDVTLDASVRATDLASLDELELELTADGPSLGAATRAFGVEHWPDLPFSINGTATRVGSTLNVPQLKFDIGGTELLLDALLSNFPGLDTSRVRLGIKGDDIAQFRELLGIHGIATGPFEARGKLDVSPQEVELLHLQMNTSFGHLTVSGTLGSGPSYDGSRLHLVLDGNDAHALMSVFDIDAMPEDSFNLDAQIETIDNGVLLERFVLVTSGNEQLELDGYLSYKPGSQDTAVDVTLNGKHLQRVLQKLIPGVEAPDTPYDLSGHIQIEADDIQLRDVKARFAEIELGLEGSISLRDNLVGTGIDFHLDGKDLSALNMFPALRSSLAVFVPGQTYHAAGRFDINSTGWGLDNIKGRIGDTDIVLNGQISKQPGWSGSNVDFSIMGPDFHAFLINREASDLSIGSFDSSGRLRLEGDRLSIRDFRFETDKTSGRADLEFGWPISSAVDADFDVEFWGDDIRHLLPGSEMFEPAMATYRISAAGQQRDNFISFERFDAVIGDLQFTLEGEVDEDIKITLAARSGDLSTLGLLNAKPLPAMALDLRADFVGGSRHFGFHNISGSLGKTDISGNMEISLGGNRPRIDLTVKSRLLDLRPFLSQFDNDDKESEVLRPKRLIPDIPLPLEALKTADLVLAFSADEIRRSNDSLRNLVVEVNVLDGRLDMPVMSINGSLQGQYRSSLTISPADAGDADVVIDIEAENMLLNLFNRPHDALSTLPLYDLEFHANGKGGDLRKLAGSLNGTLTMESDGGSLGRLNLGMLDLFLLDEVFGLIMPKSDKDDELEINCYASSFKISDGLVRTDPAIAYSSNKLILIAKGTVDLKTEELHFNFNATPTKALKVSASELFNPYIRISGTLANPDVGLDPAKALLHGGAAVGTAGISILAKGLLDRMATAKPLCEQMLEKARQDQP